MKSVFNDHIEDTNEQNEEKIVHELRNLIVVQVQKICLLPVCNIRTSFHTKRRYHLKAPPQFVSAHLNAEY